MFSTSVPDAAAVAGFFLMAPTVGPGIQAADPVEEVRFIRDEMANLGWGIERLVPNALGEPWAGAERSAAFAAGHLLRAVRCRRRGAVRYRIQTTVPEHWIPFLPVVINAGRRDIMLERGVLLRSLTEPAGGAAPAGRNPSVRAGSRAAGLVSTNGSCRATAGASRARCTAAAGWTGERSSGRRAASRPGRATSEADLDSTSPVRRQRSARPHFGGPAVERHQASGMRPDPGHRTHGLGWRTTSS